MRRSAFIFTGVFFLFTGTALSGARRSVSVPGDVKTIIGRNCGVSGCHQGRYPASNLNLEPGGLPASVLDVPSQEVPERRVIDTAAPEKSYLLAKIKGEPGIVGVRMPAYRDPLSADQIRAIEAWILSLKSGSAPAADDSKGTEPQPKNQPPAGGRKAKLSRPAFWGTRLINLPTAETVEARDFLFRISHRFIPAVASGWDGFYGLDGPAFILLSFGYGITDRLTVTVGRTNYDQEWEFTGDYRILEPSPESARPVSGALHIGGSVVAQDEPEGQDWSSRFRFNALFSLSYQVTDRISLLAVPGFASNTNYFAPDSEGTFSFGLGARARVFGDFSVIAEWVPVLAGYKDYINGWGLGVEQKIGGHVFQVFITNCYGLTAPQYLIGGDLSRFTDGFFDEFRLGFNIFRTF